MTITQSPPVRPSTGAGDGAPRPPSRRRRWRLTPYLLVAPCLIALVTLFGYPVFLVIRMSFQRLGLRELAFHETTYVGWANYRLILRDPEFWSSVVRSVVFTAAVVAATIGLGTLIALLLGRLGRVMRTAVSATLIAAWAIPVLTNVVLWLWLFDAQYGVINHALSGIGLPFAGHNWFATQWSTFFVIGVVIVWQAIPFVAFSLHAGMLSVPGELYEAARIDGAGAWKCFRAVTFPLLKPIFLILTFLSVIWDFKAFTQVWVVRQGGPDGSTVTLPLYMYAQGPTRQQFGVAAAVAVALMVLMAGALGYYIRLMVKSEAL